MSMEASYGKTRITVCDDSLDLGRRVGADVAALLRQLLAAQAEVVMILASAESQVAFLNTLAAEGDIDWSRVVCFNMDELWDPNMSEDCTCGHLTDRLLYKRVSPKRAEMIDSRAADPEAEARRFEALLRAAGPVDILCQGIGTSGHIALCEPDQIDFASNRWVEVVEVVEQSRQQLATDPAFMAMGSIPSKGITMTLPALFSARNKFTIVPFASKRPILTRLLETLVPTTSLPASILRWHEGRL